MPYGMAARVGLVSILFLVVLFFTSTASVQQKSDSLLTHKPSTEPTKSSDSSGDDAVVVNADLISFDVTVTDKSGQHITGLPQSAFTIFDEKMQQEISFFGEDDSPISVGIIFDLSGSMTQGKIRRAREALARFMETSHKDDEYYLITLQEGEAFVSMDKTRDHQAVLDKLTHITPHGTTALYDGCYLGLNKVLRGTQPRRALLLISDGEDNNSRYTYDELNKLLKESDVITYSIGVAEGNAEDLTLSGEQVLTHVAEASGGKYFHPKTEDEMYDIFERIALELRHQYAIGYRPSNFTTDGKWHRIKVKVDPPAGQPRLFIRYRTGYYALTHLR
jgi:Ca-activated chloride channel family protein